MSRILLQARNLIKHYPINQGIILARQVGAVRAVDGINFQINRKETFGLVGESGCGKTTTARLILLLENITDGSIEFEGKNISDFGREALKHYRASVQAVFQNPFGSLSPRMRVGEIIAEPLLVNKTVPKKEMKEKVADVLKLVGLRRDQADNYPHEFSGGQRQRIAIATALVQSPGLIILDEPVSALDVSIRAQIMNLLRDIQDQFGITYLLIAHDLAVVKHMSKRIGVMYLGKIVETADSDELFKNPLHPYTRALYSAALPSRPGLHREEIVLPGEVPSPINPPTGCRFHPRCSEALPVCSEREPELTDTGSGHDVACYAHKI